MAKDLPYFKFFCSEWNDGDITLENYKVQGVFINVCSYYWSKECILDSKTLYKRFREVKEEIDILISEGHLKTENNNIVISFLLEQKEEREETSKIRSKGGKASAEARRLKKLEQESNTKLTSVEHVLKSSSTETQLLREEKRREEKKRKDNIKPTILINKDKETVFNNWLNYRREIKKEIKVKSTLEGLIKKFNSESLINCKKVVGLSIENGYQGLFWDKVSTQNNNKPRKISF